MEEKGNGKGQDMGYYTYLLRCRDGSLYAGISTDLDRRMQEHARSSLGAKYTRSRPPVAFVAAWESDGRSAASRLEYRLKHMSKAHKEALACGGALPAELAQEYRPVPPEVLSGFSPSESEGECE